MRNHLSVQLGFQGLLSLDLLRPRTEVRHCKHWRHMMHHLCSVKKTFGMCIMSTWETNHLCSCGVWACFVPVSCRHSSKIVDKLRYSDGIIWKVENWWSQRRSNQELQQNLQCKQHFCFWASQYVQPWNAAEALFLRSRKATSCMVSSPTWRQKVKSSQSARVH